MKMTANYEEHGFEVRAKELPEACTCCPFWLVNTKTLEDGECYITGHFIAIDGHQDDRRMDDCPIKLKENGSELITNSDRIRSFSDEKLAMNMMCPNENGLREIECDKSDNCNCYACILKWLQSEVEE